MLAMEGSTQRPVTPAKREGGEPFTPPGEPLRRFLQEGCDPRRFTTLMQNSVTPSQN